MKFETHHVEFMPSALEPHILYVSKKYRTAAHLCACGCGSKVRTPLGPVDWSFTDETGGPTLSPSVGNWQLPCKSHYVLSSGRILWSDEWSNSQVVAGRKREYQNRLRHFARIRPSLFGMFVNWLRRLFGNS
jgi:hypothetical protein